MITLQKAMQIGQVKSAYESGKKCQWRPYDETNWRLIGEHGAWGESDWDIVLSTNQEVRIAPRTKIEKKVWAVSDVHIGALF